MGSSIIGGLVSMLWLHRSIVSPSQGHWLNMQCFEADLLIWTKGTIQQDAKSNLCHHGDELKQHCTKTMTIRIKKLNMWENYLFT